MRLTESSDLLSCNSTEQLLVIPGLPLSTFMELRPYFKVKNNPKCLFIKYKWTQFNYILLKEVIIHFTKVKHMLSCLY